MCSGLAGTYGRYRDKAFQRKLGKVDLAIDTVRTYRTTITALDRTNLYLTHIGAYWYLINFDEKFCELVVESFRARLFVVYCCC